MTLPDHVIVLSASDFSSTLTLVIKCVGIEVSKACMLPHTEPTMLGLSYLCLSFNQVMRTPRALMVLCSTRAEFKLS